MVKDSLSLARKTRRLLRDSSGVTLPLVALAATALIGFTGLGVETGLWYSIKRQDQSAADFGALSGAMELAASKGYPSICALAQRVAAQNGFTFQSFTCPTTSPACTSPASGQMCANNPPVLGPSAGDASAVEVILSQQQTALLASLSLSSATIRTRAVAKVLNNGVSCSTALNATATPGIQFQGNTNVTLNCSFAANSSSADAIDVSGNTTLNANSLWTVGNWTTNGSPSVTLSSGSFTQQYALTDPYAGTISYTKPTNQNDCVSWTTLLPTHSGTLSTPPLGSNYYCPMTFGNGDNVTLNPGVYLINGENNQNEAFRVNTGATVSGTGVTIIATGTSGSKAGAINIQGGNVSLIAPTSNQTPPAGGSVKSGLIFYQDPTIVDSQSNKGNSTITAGANVTLTGAIYTPAKNVTYTGNSSSSCTIVIADTMTFIGTSSMSASQTVCQAAGVSPPTVLSLGLLE
jgi:hypothetical protein